MSQCVLVVDDDREIVRAISLLLEREGYTVLKAYDGYGALEQVMDSRVQLLIVDIMMPRLDGLSAVMKIREKKNLPIIVLSAKSEDTDKILGLSMGADDYITKPFNPMELVARVRSQLRRYTKPGRYPYTADGNKNQQRQTHLLSGRASSSGRWRPCSSHSHGNENHGSAYAQYWPDFSC